MFDPLTVDITNRIAREGITGKTIDELVSLLDSILSLPDWKDLPIVNLQTLILLITGEKLPSYVQRLVDETRCRLIRDSLGPMWLHGVQSDSYTLTNRNKVLTSRVDQVSIYEDGFVTLTPLMNVQPDDNDELNILSDFGSVCLRN